jgi:tetratricopeptide (TPR) repeat protein
MNCASRLVFSFILALASPLPADLILEGKAAFTKGDYPAAADAFRSALSTDDPSAGLYYNLAMAEQKAGQRAEAALSLRRALTLDPRMVDAQIALSEIERSQGVPLAPPTWREIVAEHAPIKTLLIVGAAVAWPGAFLLLFTIFARAGRLLPLAGAAGLLVLGVGIFLLGYLSDPRVAKRNVAVVRDSEGVALLSSPANQSATVTRLPAASPVRILQERGEWTFCSARGGEKGWVTSKSLEAVVPAA